ncbi:transporter [Hyphomicrobium sp. 1Nfss2.1]|uniref:transporter n=1 Tax=Hyphomicrobium sp. 1Nfss2.1 TaxID=3413936 RepID=UPI003C7BB6C4
MAADKSRYSLFSPTPDRLLRDMATDRPDTTESPFTVDAGHVQIETNLFAYGRSRPDEDGVVTVSYEFVATNIRIGLTNDTEINFVWQPYGTARSRPAGGLTVRDSGIGGVDIRGKINLWGNDTFEKTGSALALLPFITLPTDEDNGISPEFVGGGLLVPLALALPNNFGLGLNGGAVWVKDDDASGYHTEYIATASLAYEWSDKLGTYWEIAATLNTDDPRGDEVIVATGVTYAVTDNLQLDAGINVGVTEASDRFNPFIGVSRRF